MLKLGLQNLVGLTMNDNLLTICFQHCRVNAVDAEEMYKSVRVLCEFILKEFSEESVEETEALNNLTTIPLLVEYVQSQTFM